MRQVLSTMSMYPKLKARLQAVATRQRRLRLWCKLAACWAGAALLGVFLTVLQRETGWATALALPIVASLGLFAAIVFFLRRGRGDPNWRDLASLIEARHPDLDGRLLTAVQQQPANGSEFNYL